MRKLKEKTLAFSKFLLKGKKLENQAKIKIKQNPIKPTKKFNREDWIGALNPNRALCTDQAPSPAFSALNPGSALNPRTLNPGTTVLAKMMAG